jgi:tRNA/rRNA methyltransferase
MQPTRQDIQTLHGVLMALAEGRKGPALGGVLNGEEAVALRALIAEHGTAQVASERAPMRGLARLLRRNPTDADRALWKELTRDKRFAGHGFKRQVPVGPHVTDFVSFPLRVVIDVEPGEESGDAAQARTHRRAWLKERGYRVIPVAAADVSQDTGAVLDSLAALIG